MTLINSTILMSDAEHFGIDHHINPYYKSLTINRDKVRREHSDIKNLFTSSGIKVIQVPSPAGCQDGIYTANWGLVRSDKVVLSNLPLPRQAEQEYAEKVFSNLGKTVFHLPTELKFSGQGDALACGDILFCGSGYRSDEAAQKMACEILGYKRIQLKTVPLLDGGGVPIINQATGWPDSYFYDIDLALAIIKPPTAAQKGLIAYCPQAFDNKSQQKLESLDNFDRIHVDLDEAKNGFATNLVSTGETVIMSANAPKLARDLTNHDLKVITTKITELSKGGGYIRCVALTLD